MAPTRDDALPPSDRKLSTSTSSTRPSSPRDDSATTLDDDGRDEDDRRDSVARLPGPPSPTRGGGGGGGGAALSSSSPSGGRAKPKTTKKKKKRGEEEPSRTTANDDDDDDGEERIVVAETTPSPPARKRKTPPSSSTSTSTSSPRRPCPSFSEGTNGKPPTYVQMIHGALESLKAVRGGGGSGGGSSSVPAISKHLTKEHPERFGDVHPNIFKQSVGNALKAAVKSGRFVKVKASYKINSEWVKKERRVYRAKEAEKRAKERKRQRDAERARRKHNDEEAEKRKRKNDAEERKRKARMEEEEEDERNKKKRERALTEEERSALEKKRAAEAEAERRKREAAIRAERIRKRKFPMDDLKLIEEDAELRARPPDFVRKRRHLPCVWTCSIPLAGDERRDWKRFPSHFATASSSSDGGGGGGGIGGGSRGLFSDLLQVYHFFRGDVGYGGGAGGDVDDRSGGGGGAGAASSSSLTPPFAVKHLVCALDEVLNGNAKAGRVVPPLISHLFVTALRLVLTTGDDDGGDADDAAAADGGTALSPRREALRSDFSKLLAALSPLTWSEVCRHYMDAMERYYATDLSVDPKVLRGGTIRVGFGDGGAEEGEEESATGTTPDGYRGYLGDPRGALSRGHAKLRDFDPWTLSAEELMALLRALTDDVLGTREEIGAEFAKREDELYELLKTKRLADSNYRKTKFACEGPKQPPVAGKSGASAAAGGGHRANATSGGDASSGGDSASNRPLPADGNGDDPENDEDGDARGKERNDDDDDTDSTKALRPTATKAQLASADRARSKANDAYEKGVRRLVVRTEPLGYDRHRSAIYFFHRDPEMVYVENKKGPPTGGVATACAMGPRTWQTIETKSLFDHFLSSLDVRGTRERALNDALAGASIRRHLDDDIKRKQAVVARKREEADLERRLADATTKACAAEEEQGRRSGRLASLAQVELARVEEEIKLSTVAAEADAAPRAANYFRLTGLEMLSEFEARGSQTKSSSPRDDGGGGIECLNVPSGALWRADDDDDDDGLDGGGIAGVLVGAMIRLENDCNALAPWERDDVRRKLWIAKLREVAESWNRATSMRLGPAGRPCGDDGGPDPKRCEDLHAAERTGSGDAGGKKTKRAPVSQMVSSLKGPLLDLEDRVYAISGFKKAAREADEASENISISSSAEEEGNDATPPLCTSMEWKKKLDALTSIPTKRAGAIRDVLVSAIAAAQRARLNDVTRELRSALLLHRPGAGGEAKAAALGVLKRHGGYQEANHGDYDDDGMDGVETSAETASAAVAEPNNQSDSLLSGEAMMLTGSLRGDKNADRVDWRDAVKMAKTMSRLAALAQTFLRSATVVLTKLEADRDTLLNAIEYWNEHEMPTDKKRGSRSKKRKGKYTSATQVWANARLTDRFVWGKIPRCPWWPSRICELKDRTIASSLASAGRTMISFVGEEFVYAVEETDIKPYEGKDILEDLSSYDSDMIKSLKASITMARRIYHGQSRDRHTQLQSTSETLFAEEKKSAI